MSQERTDKDRILFSQLVITFYDSAWQSLGKVMSPVTGEVERNLEATRHYIDMLDMIKKSTSGNLGPDEASFLDGALYQLKMNYVEELEADKKAGEAKTAAGAEAKGEAERAGDETAKESGAPPGDGEKGKAERKEKAKSGPKTPKSKKKPAGKKKTGKGPKSKN